MWQIQLMGEPFIYVDGVPETYATEDDAIAVLEQTIAEDIEAVEDGFLEDVTEPSEFRIVFLGV
jgi:hypothetical protein